MDPRGTLSLVARGMPFSSATTTTTTVRGTGAGTGIGGDDARSLLSSFASEGATLAFIRYLCSATPEGDREEGVKEKEEEGEGGGEAEEGKVSFPPSLQLSRIVGGSAKGVEEELAFSTFCSQSLFDCLSRDCTGAVIPVLLSLRQCARLLSLSVCTQGAWTMKLALAFYGMEGGGGGGGGGGGEEGNGDCCLYSTMRGGATTGPLVPREYLAILLSEVESSLNLSVSSSSSSSSSLSTTTAKKGGVRRRALCSALKEHCLSSLFPGETAAGEKEENKEGEKQFAELNSVGARASLCFAEMPGREEMRRIGKRYREREREGGGRVWSLLPPAVRVSLAAEEAGVVLRPRAVRLLAAALA